MVSDVSAAIWPTCTRATPLVTTTGASIDEVPEKNVVPAGIVSSKTTVSSSDAVVLAIVKV